MRKRAARCCLQACWVSLFMRNRLARLPQKRASVLLLMAIWLTACAAARGQNFTRNYPDTVNLARLWTTGSALTATAAGVSVFLGFVWYADQERVPFHFYNDLEGYLQMDKWGHAYGAYFESYHAYYALRWSGLSEKKALIWGGPYGFLAQAPIEIFDGLYEGWGFSWSDIGANALGSALFAGQQALWQEQRILMKFSYQPSRYASLHDDLGETPLERFFLDYNAHTYWLSANIRRFSGWERIPPWINLSLGYSANGMINEFSNPDFYRGEPFPELARYRQWIVSPDIDLSRIPTRKAWVASLLKYLNMLKIPMSAVEYNSVEGWRLRALYY